MTNHFKYKDLCHKHGNQRYTLYGDVIRYPVHKNYELNMMMVCCYCGAECGTMLDLRMDWSPEEQNKIKLVGEGLILKFKLDEQLDGELQKRINNIWVSL